MTDKRKRSPNWLLSEKSLLLELVEKHFSVVENKKTDGVTMKQKLAEWEVISHEYNSQTTHCSRSAENLKTHWESLKKTARKEEASLRIHRIQTGGGPAADPKKDPVHEKIISLIKTSAVGLFNPFDSDSVEKPIADAQVTLPAEPVIYVEIETDINEIKNTGVDSKVIVDSNEEVGIQDWSDYTPKLLRTPVSKPLQANNNEHGKLKQPWFSRRRPAHSASSLSLEKMHEKKIEAINFQMSVAGKERLHVNEAHELDMEIKREQLKQEKIKTRILLLDLKLKKKQYLPIN